MPGQMSKDVAAQIARDPNESEARRPARDTPQKVIGGDQRHEENECQPYAAAMRSTTRQTIDQGFDAVLGAHGTGNGRSDSAQDHQVRREPAAKIAQDKGKWPARVSGELIHVTATP